METTTFTKYPLLTALWSCVLLAFIILVVMSILRYNNKIDI